MAEVTEWRVVCSEDHTPSYAHDEAEARRWCERDNADESLGCRPFRVEVRRITDWEAI